MARNKHPSQVMEVLFEMRKAGKHGVRVAAIDPISRTEVTMVGDMRYGEEMLKRLAARKLWYVINKKRQEKSKG